MGVLKHVPQWYVPGHTRSVDIGELRREYSRLRKSAIRRLEAFKRTSGRELDLTETEAYQQYVTPPARLSEMTDEHMRYELAKLARWLGDSKSSVKAQQARAKAAIESLHESGYTFVNRANYINFGKFMEEYRRQRLDHTIGSPTAADLFEAVQEKKIDPSKVYTDFNDWLQNVDALKEMPFQRERSGRKSRSLKSYKMELKKNGKWKE